MSDSPYTEGWPQTIVADGPDGRVDSFYSATDLPEMKVVPLSDAERLQEERDAALHAAENCFQRHKRLREALEVVANYAVSEKDRNVARAALNPERGE